MVIRDKQPGEQAGVQGLCGQSEIQPGGTRAHTLDGNESGGELEKEG